jgi:hypothetical protein
MSQPLQPFKKRGFTANSEAASAETNRGPVEISPALFDSPPSSREGIAPRSSLEDAPLRGAQLPLPLDLEPETLPTIPPKTRRKGGSQGFVPVTRDPDVAKSYSDNVALDYAVAKGLAQALSSLPPEELAALRAKVAQASQLRSRPTPSRKSR